MHMRRIFDTRYPLDSSALTTSAYPIRFWLVTTAASARLAGCLIIWLVQAFVSSTQTSRKLTQHVYTHMYTNLSPIELAYL